MVGKYSIEVNNKYTKYFLTVQRNFTILQGNSATGKTELIRLLSQYEENGEASGVHVSCNVPIHVLRGRFWKEDILRFHNSIIFLDESEQYAKTKEFAEAVQKNDNYFFIVNRDPLHELSYNINEIYTFRNVASSQKYHEAFRVYNEMVPLYHMNLSKEIIADKVIEDFYEKTLTEASLGTAFQYQKKTLNPAYLSDTAIRKIARQMPAQILPEEYKNA